MEQRKKEIPGVVLGVKLDENALTALREGKETELITGFVSQKSGKVFDAYLKLGANNQIRFRFPEKKKKAPSFPNKVPSKVGGVELDPEDIEDLKAGRETKLIVGLESKKKGKYYDAYLR
ncbi:MAG: topoisomerase C-terminal repeat-containing protein, partial [Cytophagaceae bacterium]|nr:topoisomerase C-terminal repeat-containing protein [Cytophagaceae bacterium]